MTWVCLLDAGMQLQWPWHEKVVCQFPKYFKKYLDTRVIIDATEFFIEKPPFP